MDWNARRHQRIHRWLSSHRTPRHTTDSLPAPNGNHWSKRSHGSALRARRKLVFSGLQSGWLGPAGALGGIDFSWNGWSPHGSRFQPRGLRLRARNGDIPRRRLRRLLSRRARGREAQGGHSFIGGWSSVLTASHLWRFDRIHLTFRPLRNFHCLCYDSYRIRDAA